MLSSMPGRKSTTACKKVSKAFTRKRHLSKFMEERIYRNTGVVVAIGSSKYILYLCFLISAHDTQGWHCSSTFPLFLKKKTLTGKEDHSNDILTNFYCHSYRTSNQNVKTDGCTLHSLPQLTHILKHYSLWTTSSFTEKIKLLFCIVFNLENRS